MFLLLYFFFVEASSQANISVKHANANAWLHVVLWLKKVAENAAN